MGEEAGAQAARSRALAVLRVRGRALAVALLPAAAAVVLLAGGATDHLVGPGWDSARWAVTAVAVVVLLAAAGIALVVARARPALSPTVPVAEDAAPDLYRMVRDLAERLDVPAPSAIALTPDCDSWLEDRTHPGHGPAAPERHDEIAGRAARRTPEAPVLVIGSPFLWWMRVGELRAVLAPVVAGTGPSAHPDIAAARRFVRGLDAAVAVAATPTRSAVSRVLRAVVGWVVRPMLRGCRQHAVEMERGVAAAAAERAQTVDYGLRIAAQEQVGLAYAGWDRLLTRVALPAWRMGRWPSRLDVGVVAALTELSRRDRLAEGFTSRLGERPACDLLEEPGLADEAASLLAARLFHGGPAEPGPDWSPVEWQDYPDEVVDRKWRTDAARLHRVLDTLGVRAAGPHSQGPTLARVLDHLADPDAAGAAGTPDAHTLLTPDTPQDGTTSARRAADVPQPGPPEADGPTTDGPATDGPGADVPEADTAGTDTANADTAGADTAGADTAGADTAGADTAGAQVPERHPEHGEPAGDEGPERSGATGRCSALAEGLTAALAREEAEARPAAGASAVGRPVGTAEWDDGLPLFPLQPPRTPRELLADHITALVCCSAVDTAGAAPGLDWLDGPSLLVDGERATDLTPRVLSLIEDGDPAPLRSWLTEVGIRPEKPVRLV